MPRAGSALPGTLRRTALAGSILAGSILAGCGAEPGGEISVVLVSPDSLRADRLRPWNPDAPPTPALERLAARGTVYLNAWSSSPWTAPSMVSVMTGLYPPSHGVAYRDDTTPSTLPTLPRLLAANGYEIGNFSFFSQISYFRNLGLGDAEPGLSHARVADSFRGWLARLAPEKRFFAWVHLLETHLPYGASGYQASAVSIPGSTGLEEAQLNAVVPAGSVAFEAGDRERLIELYDRDVEEMDRALARVLDALEEHRRLESTAVVFVADHGEELLDHGWIGHASTAIEAKLVPEILRVPLVLAGPGVPAGEVRRELVRQVDILPALTRLLGLDAPPVADGRPLPGTFRRWPGLPWGGDRRLAHFDSSPGGNLTPRDKRGERLQGITDGDCLVTTHVTPEAAEEVRSESVGGGCGSAATGRLLAELERWREQQAEQRLAVLARYPEGSAPPSAEVDAYAEAITVLAPRSGERLDWRSSGGQVTFEWSGPGRSFWIEYRLGRAPLEISGSFQVSQQRVVFGPVPEGFWNDVATYSPSRIRIADAENRQRSPWVEFEVLPIE